MTNPTPPASPTSAEDEYARRRDISIGAAYGVGDPSLVLPAAPSPVARGEWPKGAVRAAYNAYMRAAASSAFDQGEIILDALASVGALRPPSPPGVVGKPTREQIAETLFEADRNCAPGKNWKQQGKNSRSKWYWLADKVLCAPIWPTSEPPAPITAAMHEAAAIGRGLWRAKPDGTMEQIPYAETLAEPPATVDAEVEEITKRHNAGYRGAPYHQLDGPIANRDRATLLTKLRQRTGSGITREDVHALVCRCVTHGEGQDWLTDSVMALITGKKG